MNIDAADWRVLERNRSRVERGGNSGNVVNAIFRDVTNRALDGQFNAFNRPFIYKDRIVILKPDCLGNVADQNVRFLIDHLASSEVADTNDGSLELMIDSDSGRFRLDLEKTARGCIIARMCDVGNRAAMSVGIDITEEHDEVISGYTVRVITSAILREISLVKDGVAGDDAWATLVDTTTTPKPVAGSRSPQFQLSHDQHKFNRTIRGIKSRIYALLDDGPKSERALRARIADLRNDHWSASFVFENDFDCIARMQKQARARLGLL
jgi:phage head maturation protease